MNSLLSTFDGAGPIVWRMSWHTAILALVIFSVLVGTRRRIPARWQFLMWSLVFVRLITPSLPETRWSLFNWLSPSIAEQGTIVRSAKHDASVEASVDDPGRMAGPRDVPIEELPFTSELDERVADSTRSTRSAESMPIPKAPMVSRRSEWMFDLSQARWKIAGSVWLVGISFGGWLVSQFLRLRRQTGLWLEAENPSLMAVFERCRARFGISRRVRLCVAPGDVGPAVCGVFRPAIVVPEKLVAELVPVQWEYVFLHEMAHIARNDVAWQWLVMIVRTIHWFNPAVWWAEAKLKAAREEACDSMVLDAIGGEHRWAYCDLLCRMVPLVDSTKICPALLGMPATTRRLSRRFEMIHDYRRPSWLTSVAAIGLLAGVAALGLTDGVRDSPAQAQQPQAATSQPTTNGKAPAGDAASADAAPAAATSRSWHILRQPNTHVLLHGLPQRVDRFLTSPRTGVEWEGVAGGGSLKIRIDTEGDAAGEIVLAFFADPRAGGRLPPVQLRSFPGPGEYIVDKLPLGKLQIGALVGGLPRPKAYGVHQTWPAPVEVNAREIAETRVLVSASFQWLNLVRNTRDFTGDWPKMNPDRLITVRTVDEQGNPVPFCRVTLVRRDAQNTYDFHELGIDDGGNAYSDAVNGTFSITAQRHDFVPETLATRWQLKKIEQLHDATDHPTITVQWEPFPTGSATLTGRVTNQRSESLNEFHVDISSYKGEQKDWSDASGFWMRIPVIDAEGRFEVKGLAAGKYEITAHAFDYYTHVYEWNAKREFVVPEQPNAAVEVDVQLEAREMRYGRAVYVDGSPVYPGGWSALFEANNSTSWNTNADGTFRVGLSVRERELLNKNSDGLVEVHGSGTPRVERTVRAEHLSLDPANPYKVVLPRPNPPPESKPADDRAALPAPTRGPDDAKAAEALRRIAGYVKVHPNGAASEISFLQTNVTDDDLVHLKGTPSVTKLDLQRSNITDAGLVHLRGLANLESLNLRATKVTDAGMESLKDLTRLQSLDIACRGITDAGMRHLERLTNLKDLHVESTQITDAGLTSLQGLTKLEELILPRTITDAGLKSLERMTDLRRLGMIGCRLTEAGVIELARFSKLEDLSLGAVPVTDAGIERLIGLGQLQSLNLLSSAVTDKGLALLKSLTNLRTLAISPAITDDGLAVLREFPKLEALTIPCPNITDAGMAHLAELKQLTNIRLYDTQVTDEGAARLAVLKSLIALDLARTQVTAKGIEFLRDSLPRMQHLEGP